MNPKPIEFHYTFKGRDKNCLSYQLQLHPESLDLLIPESSSEPPDWAKLEVSQCKNCPLNPKESPYCPIAKNLAQLVLHFKDSVSHETVEILVETKERTYLKEAPLQVGLFSIFGIIMATSGCPVMNFLKPMAKFHLPFSSIEETVIRSVSFYLLKQYFVYQKGETADLLLEGLDKKYSETQDVNQGMIGRIQQVMKSGDANQNSITTLDCFSKLLSMMISRNLQKYASLFETT